MEKAISDSSQRDEPINLEESLRETKKDTLRENVERNSRITIIDIIDECVKGKKKNKKHAFNNNIYSVD